MRGFAIITLIALIGLSPSLTSAAVAPGQRMDLIEKDPPDRIYPVVLAAGALAGVMTVNWLNSAVIQIPLRVGMESTAPLIAPEAAAASRIFVITSGVIGAWIADLLYQ